jgi:hypothetical protein
MEEIRLVCAARTHTTEKRPRECSCAHTIPRQGYECSPFILRPQRGGNSTACAVPRNALACLRVPISLAAVETGRGVARLGQNGHRKSKQKAFRSRHRDKLLAAAGEVRPCRKTMLLSGRFRSPGGRQEVLGAAADLSNRQGGGLLDFRRGDRPRSRSTSAYLARRYTCSTFPPVGSGLMVVSFSSSSAKLSEVLASAPSNRCVRRGIRGLDPDRHTRRGRRMAGRLQDCMHLGERITNE